ncbi:hypothetical protein ACFY8O_18550 [Streptomyces argenteolus]|uniref:DUF4255 domain-containing protein n=1 Tax=Streptomyces argenteolus TaxID=67274 RepID=A0ABW6X9M1_9ACTN
MGLAYGYDIHLPPENVAGALVHLARLAPPGRDTPPLELTLPGGALLALPFTSDFRSGPVDCSTSSTVDLDLSLMFGVDEAVRDYAEAYGHEIEEDGRVRIGYVYLTIRFESLLHPRYAALEFWAATSTMSRLFARSARVREVFTGLTAASGGVCCVFDIGDGSFGPVCWRGGETVQPTDSDAAFPDREALVASWPDPGAGRDPGSGFGH